MIARPKGVMPCDCFRYCNVPAMHERGYENARCSNPQLLGGRDQLRNAMRTYAVMFIVIGQKHTCNVGGTRASTCFNTSLETEVSSLHQKRMRELAGSYTGLDIRRQGVC